MDYNVRYKQFDCGFAMFEVDSDDEATDGWCASYSEMEKVERVQAWEVEREEVRGSQHLELHENDTWIEKQVNFINMCDMWYICDS